MKKFIGLLFVTFFLSSCGPTNYSQVIDLSRQYGYYSAYAEPESRLDQNLGAYAAYPPAQYSQKEVNEMALKTCATRYNDCVLTHIGSRLVYKGTYSASANTSYSYSTNSSSSGFEGFQSDTVSLYYDKSSGGMRECLYNPGALGECNAFKPYSANSYNKDTLFYNSKTNSMQPCIGIVTVEGKCTAFGIFNYNRHAQNKNQLFYDKSRNVMTTCAHTSATGECFHYDTVARSGSSGGQRGYRMTNPSNPYHKVPPSTPQQSISLGMDMIMGRCTLGLDC